MSAVHPLDLARLADLARLQRAMRQNGFLGEDDRRDLVALVRILLHRHGGDGERAEAVAEHLLQHALTVETLFTPTIAMLMKVAAQGTQGRASSRAVGARRP